MAKKEKEGNKLQPRGEVTSGKDTSWFADFDNEESQFIDWMKWNVTNHPVVIEKHPKWKELIAWENGDQFSEWDRDDNRMKSVTLKRRKVKVVVNMMKPLIETIDGKLNFFHSVIGSPNTSEAEDIRSSKIATKLIKSNDNTNYMDAHMEELKFDFTRTGNCFEVWRWDGDMVAKTKTGTTDGDLYGYVPSVFNIRPDPSARKWQTMRYFIEVDEVTKDDLIKAFPKVPVADFDKLHGGASEQFDAINSPQEDRASEHDSKEKTYIAITLRQKKNHFFPKGRYAIVVEDRVFHVGENKNPHQDLGCFHQGYKRNGNSFWYTGPLHHSQPLQRQLNRMVSIASEHYEGWRAKMAVPRGSIVRKEAFTTDSFELLEVDTTKGKIQPIQMPQLGEGFTEHRNFVIASFDKVGNIHEVSYARLPQYASRAPASLYSMMLEQENTQFTPMLKKFNRTILERDRFRLQVMEKKYTRERLVKVVGKAEANSIEYFKGAELLGNTDVQLDVGVSLNQSATVQQRMLIELWQNNMLPPSIANKMLKYMNLGTAEQDLRGDIADEGRAMREDQHFVDGKWKEVLFDERADIIYGVYKHDDHFVHLEQHTNLAKSEEAHGFDENAWIALNGHIEIHFRVVQALKKASQGMVEQPVAQTQPGGNSGQMASAPGEGIGGEVPGVM